HAEHAACAARLHGPDRACRPQNTGQRRALAASLRRKLESRQGLIASLLRLAPRLRSVYRAAAWIATSCRSPRIKIRPPEIAGDAITLISSLFLARTSGVLPPRSTSVSPFSPAR